MPLRLASKLCFGYGNRRLVRLRCLGRGHRTAFGRHYDTLVVLEHGGQRLAAGCCGTASDELCRLVVLNTASIQLLPSTVAAIRGGLGCAAPLDILPAVWLSSAVSVAAGLTAAGLLRRLWRS